MTGAGGYIGEKITHRLVLQEGIEVTPLVHQISGPNVLRVSRLPVKIQEGSILDIDFLERLMPNCDAVINCAHGTRETATTGTKNLITVAEKNGIDTFVHLSSAVVHGHYVDSTVDESCAAQPDTQYAKVKLESEKSVLSSADSIEPTIFRPCIVYGPHSPWVQFPIKDISNGAILINSGTGSLNGIYIENLLDAMVAALQKPAAKGEIFLLSDENDVTWGQYYRDYYTQLNDAPPIVSIPTEELKLRKGYGFLRDSVVPFLRVGPEIIMASHTKQILIDELRDVPWAAKVFNQLPANTQQKVKSLQEDETSFTNVMAEGYTSNDPSYDLPPKHIAKMQMSTGIISNHKLKSHLDWEPRISYSDSMDIIGEWLEYTEI